MDKCSKKEMKKEINTRKIQNSEAIISMLIYCIEAGIYSIMAFGVNHDVSKDVLNIWIENYRIFQEENYLLNLLKKKSNEMESDVANEFLDELDSVYDETIPYYYKVLDDILTAAEMKESYRALRVKRNFNTLIETDEYRKRLELSERF